LIIFIFAYFVDSLLLQCNPTFGSHFSLYFSLPKEANFQQMGNTTVRMLSTQTTETRQT